MDIRCTSIVWLALLVLDVPCGAIAQDKKLPLVGSGIIVGKEDAVKWNRVILLATPRIASGDTSKLSETVRTAVSKLTLTILATVESEVVGDGTEAYRLSEVGVGYSTIIKENRVTITSETAGRMGAGLDFYGRQMLSENEEQIGNLKVIFRTSTLTVFDAPAIMLRDGQHKDFLTRHLIWVDPKPVSSTWPCGCFRRTQMDEPVSLRNRYESLPRERTRTARSMSMVEVFFWEFRPSEHLLSKSFHQESILSGRMMRRRWRPSRSTRIPS